MPEVIELPLETEEAGTVLKCRKDGAHGRYKTSVSRPHAFEHKPLYVGFDPEEAIRVYEECLERFDIGKVKSLSEIEWDD